MAADLQAEIDLILRHADPVNADLSTRLVALEQAALQAQGGVPDLMLAAMAAARQAAEQAAGEEGCGLRERIRAGDWIVGRLATAFHEPVDRSLKH
ncbi:hypothetical protein [Geminicoccus flavidas]|uniref:hypothetical protein n=1 Tax=Geminicoccus flavidas TaxID=2506407 RepID=UPI001357C9B3|nr:hypothetical protein [Geminicoccus flavidas]